MPEYLRKDAFIKIADVDLEFEDEVGFNMIFFYNTLDRGEFVGHEDKWVTVNDQKVIEYGKEYSNDQLNSVFKIMPNAIQLPVDQTRLLQSKPTKMVIAQRTNNGDDHKGWSSIVVIAKDYSTPTRHIHASMMFKVSIGDDYNWTKWVQAKILLWEGDPGNQVEYALVGNDVIDQLAYIHEPENPLKFLNLEDETRLTIF
ncbi:ATP dependent DNA helicase [Gigaspora margarita]|uniref:ATP dependent DNA helicase n=1 Tax=Gigaspora margarita TaxID=4874 RepID=A0A8H3ZZK6_GIGMA|nr:ATP dependent DNA helicase [Gigaspora margarita]